jgi:hypothetical protein
MSEPNVIPAPEAARRAGRTRQAIYYALDRGALSGVRFGGSRLVKLDARWERYAASEDGEAGVSAKQAAGE